MIFRMKSCNNVHRIDEEGEDGSMEASRSLVSPGDDVSDAKNNVDDSVMEVAKVIHWSHRLQTPRQPGFSPSVPFRNDNDYTSSDLTRSVHPRALFSDNDENDTKNDSNVETTIADVVISYHGFGLIMACTRAKQLASVGQRSTLLLLETTKLCDQYSRILVQAGNDLANALVVSDGVDIAATTSSRFMINQIQESIVSWGGEVSMLSKTIRTTIAQPLHNYLITNRDASVGLRNRYVRCRKSCSLQRKHALQTRTLYLDAVQQAEQLVMEWKSPNSENQRSENDTVNKNRDDISKGGLTHAKILEKVKTIKTLDGRYKKQMKWENDSVEQCQRLECMALETLQKLEEDRLILWTHSIGRIIKLKRLMLDRIAFTISSTNGIPSSVNGVGSHDDESCFDESNRSQHSIIVEENNDNNHNSKARREIQFINSNANDSVCSESNYSNHNIIENNYSFLVDGIAPESPTKGGGDFFNRLRLNSASSIGGIINIKQSSNTNHGHNNSQSLNSSYLDNYENSAGVMDTETFGLPIEIGRLRDKARSVIENRINQINSARNIASVLFRIETALTKLGNALQHHITAAAEENIHNNDETTSTRQCKYADIEDEMRSVGEMDCIVELWRQLSQMLRSEGTEALALAEQLRKHRIEKLQRILDYGEKSMKRVSDQDNATWKQLCDTARIQTQSEIRYREVSTETAKTRERIKSETDVGSNAVQNTFANMLSILPSTGEYTMKFFDSSESRATMNQKSLEDADQKVMKERQRLDSAVELTSLSMEAYKSTATAVIAEYTSDEDDGWANFVPTLEAFVECVESSRVRQLDVFDETNCTPSNTQKVAFQINLWSSAIHDNIQVLKARIGGDSESHFVLQNNDDVPSVLREFLSADVVDETNILSIGDSNGSNHNTNESGGIVEESLLLSPIRHIQSASSSLIFPTINIEDNAATAWLRRSLSFPEKTESPLMKSNRKESSKEEVEVAYKYDKIDDETSIFCAFFWLDQVNPRTVPRVLCSYACSFRDGNNRLPSQYGRIFVSNERLVFVSWTGKQVALKWTEVLSVGPKKNFLGHTIDCLIVKCQRSSSDELCMLLDGFYDRTATQSKIEEIRDIAKAANAKKEAVESSIPDERSTVPPDLSDATSSEHLDTVPLDETLKRMKVVLSERLSHVPIQRFYEIIWSEGNGTKEKPFYKPWLEKECFDVEVSDWNHKEVVGQWSGEKYSQTRSVHFKVKRKTHLYIGPPIANVSQTQLCRVEGNDKCVVDFLVEFEGIPYSDTFVVQVRWVATREGRNDILVEVGVFVDFKKSTFLKSKIQSGTVEETSLVHKALFDDVKTACLSVLGEVDPSIGTGLHAPEVSKQVDPTGSQSDLADLKSTVLQSISKHMIRDRGVIVLSSAIIVICVMIAFMRPGGGNPVSTASENVLAGEIATLRDRIQNLEGEIMNVQQTLREIVDLLKQNQ